MLEITFLINFLINRRLLLNFKFSDFDVRKFKVNTQYKKYNAKVIKIDINVMTSCDDRLSVITTVLILSISESHKEYNINFYLFHAHISEEHISIIDNLCKNLPNVSFHEIRLTDLTYYEKLKGVNNDDDYERFFWLEAHRYLPQDMERILYLDALDTVVVKDISGFYFGSFEDKFLIASREINQYEGQFCVGPAMGHYEKNHDADTVKRIAFGILNSGSIVLNLPKFRAMSVPMDHYLKVYEWSKDLTGITFGDQGLFSLVYGRNFKTVDVIYNYRFTNGQTRRSKDVCIIHFCGGCAKPHRFIFTKEREELIKAYIRSTGKNYIDIYDHNNIGRHRLYTFYFLFYRRWWDFCEKTPAYEVVSGFMNNVYVLDS